MKHRSLKWSLGVTFTVLTLAATRQLTAAETSNPPTRIEPASMAEEGVPSVPEEGLSQEAAPDTDAPAKLVSTDKPLPATIKPSSPVAEVIKLANSGLDESVMLAFVTNSVHTFNLGAEEIIYLNDIGVPGLVVTAMIQRDQELKGLLAAGAAPPASLPEPPPEPTPPPDQSMAPLPEPPSNYAAEAPLTPPGEVSDSMFYDSLAPYGNWVDVEGYGRCWQPTAVVVNSGWQPYFDCGHWVYSDCGWYWLSDYSWGWAPFHYGSWFRHARLGWCWVPGRVWGPSWVSWRYTDRYCGWAPLPPGASFAVGVGLTFHGHRVGERDDFGLRPHHYHFVDWDHFHDRRLRPSGLHRNEIARVWQNSTVATRINGDGHTVINNGLPPSRVAAATRRPLHTVALRDAGAPRPTGGRVERYEAGERTLTVYRPKPTTLPPSHQVTTTTPIQPTPPGAAPWGPRSTTTYHQPNAANENRAGALILRGPQSSGVRETPPPSSLVVIGRGTTPVARRSYEPESTSAGSVRQGPNSHQANDRPASPGTVPQRPASRPNEAQGNWMGTVSSSPAPAWLGNRGSGVATRPTMNTPASRPEVRTYQSVPRNAEVPRYSPAPRPSYVPQRSYSPTPMSAPSRAPAVESRPAQSAPSAASAPSASRSQPSSSGNGRGR